ncbi:MAG: lipid kinase, partial [Rhodospirillaceae bacterium]|nr:lipid kinase [Rhodospirillaceae bacterium]
MILINAKARHGAGAGAEVAAILRAGGLDTDCEAPSDPEALAAAIRDHRHAVDLVVVGGGDGTLNAAAPALVETGLPLGIVPLGTANDLTRTLEIPLDFAGACATILHGRRHRIDLGRVNDRLFFNVASLGLGERVAAAVRADQKRRWGAAAYAAVAARLLRRNRPFPATIDCDGRTVRLRSIQIAVGNGRHYGGGLTVSEQAAIDDHRLDLYSIAPLPWWRLIGLAPGLRSGRLKGREAVRLMQDRRITVRTRRPMP